MQRRARRAIGHRPDVLLWWTVKGWPELLLPIPKDRRFPRRVFHVDVGGWKLQSRIADRPIVVALMIDAVMGKSVVIDGAVKLRPARAISLRVAPHFLTVLDVREVCINRPEEVAASREVCDEMSAFDAVEPWELIQLAVVE